MNFVDYREKLGIGFCDKEKLNYFLVRIFNKLNMIAEDNYEQTVDPEEYWKFCNLTGTHIDYAELTDTDTCRGRYQHCLNILTEHNDDLRDFLSYYIAFANSVNIQKKGNRVLTRVDLVAFLVNALDAAHIQFEVETSEDKEIFIFPKGAVELDSALISQPLEWLRNYPKSHKTYCIALKQYANEEYIRDVADNLRKALESFLQEFLGNEKNLETNKTEICRYLSSQNVDSGINSLFSQIINAYKNLNDRIAKHNDKVDSKLLEFLLYQTGVLVRMVLVVKQAEMEENSHAH